MMKKIKRFFDYSTLLVKYNASKFETEKLKMKCEEYLKNHNELLYSSSLSKREIDFIINK